MRGMRLTAVAVWGLALAIAQGAPDTDWDYRMPIVFAGYDRGETLANFPVLVVLSNNVGGSGFRYDDFFHPASGAELRFFAADRLTELDYEIEQWNPAEGGAGTNGASYGWVRLPALTNGTTIYAYWGREDAVVPPPYTTNGAVWDVDERAVWHLHDAADNATARDATATARHAANDDTSRCVNVTGAIGDAQRFDPAANTSGFSLPGGLGDLSATGTTVMAWVNLRSNGSYPMILAYSGNAMSLRFNSNDRRLQSDDVIGLTVDAGDAIATGEWHHVAMTFDDSNDVVRLFVDGRLAKEGLDGDHLPASGEAFIGRRVDGYRFDGLIDELRVAGVARSTNWIWASWFSQASNAAFAAYGPVMELSPARPRFRNALPTAITRTSATLRGTMYTGAPPVTAWCAFDTADRGTAGWAFTNVFATVTNPAPVALATNVAVPADRMVYYRFGGSNGTAATWAPDAQSFLAGQVWFEPAAAFSHEDGMSGTVIVHRAATATNGAITVTYTVGGTATPDVDYAALPGTLTLAEGVDAAPIVVAPLADANPAEGTEFVALTLQPGLYELGAPANATITIRDSLTNLFVGSGNWDLTNHWRWGVAPAAATDTGLVPVGRTAYANVDLGTDGNRPTIVIDAGGRVDRNPGVAFYGPIVLNGGTLQLHTIGDQYSPIRVLTNSVIESPEQCCNGRALHNVISGPGHVTFIRLQGGGRELYLDVASDFSGGIEFQGIGTPKPIHLGHLLALSSNGPPEAPNTVTVGAGAWLAQNVEDLVRDFTLAGGDLGLEWADWMQNYTRTLHGNVTLTAPSRLRVDHCCDNNRLVLDGTVSGPHRLATYGSPAGVVELPHASPDWTGGLDIQKGVCRVTTNGAWGTGPIRIYNADTNATFELNAAADQDWTLTNEVSGSLGIIQVESATNCLTLAGSVLDLGAAAGLAGRLAINGRLAFAEHLGAPVRWTVDVTATGTTAGVDFDRLTVSAGDAELAASLSNATLTVNVSEEVFTGLLGATRTILAAPGVDFSGQAFRSVAWNGPVGRVTGFDGGVRLEFDPVGPIVNNANGASAVGLTQATLNGWLSTTGEAATAVAACWGTSDTGAGTSGWQHVTWLPGTYAPGPVATTVTTTSNTVYYYRFYATNVWGGYTATNASAFMSAPVSVAATDPAAAEDGPDPGTFTLTRPTAATGAIAIPYSLGGTAANGVDYSFLGGLAAFAQGASQTTVSVVPIHDAAPEGGETVVLGLPGGNYVSGSPSSDTVTIAEAAELVFITNGNWTVAARWNPTNVPSAAGQVGVVPAGLTATANADLGAPGNRPLIRIDAGGRVNENEGISATPFVLNGGTLRQALNADHFSPIALLADSVIESPEQCCNGKTMYGVISGGGHLTFIREQSGNAGLSWNAANTFSGGIAFQAVGTPQPLALDHALALSTNGPPSAPNVVVVGPGVTLNQGASVVTRDLTLAGGAYGSGRDTHTLYGTLMLAADSALATLDCCYGGTLAIAGELVGTNVLRVQAGPQSRAGEAFVELRQPSPAWTGGLDVQMGWCTLATNGAQGLGPIRLGNAGTNATLYLNTTPDQDWVVSNAIAGKLGNIRVENGNRQVVLPALTVGDADGPGRCNVQGHLRLTGPLAMVIEGPNVYDGTNSVAAYSRLTVSGDLDLNGQPLDVRLRTVPHDQDAYVLVMNSGTNAVTGQFAGLPEGAQTRIADGIVGRITYTANADFGPVGNDVKLYDLRSLGGTLMMVR